MTKWQIRGSARSRQRLIARTLCPLIGYRVVLRRPDGTTHGPYFAHPKGWAPVMHGVSHSAEVETNRYKECGRGVNFFPDLGSAVRFAEVDAVPTTRRGETVEVWDVVCRAPEVIIPIMARTQQNNPRTIYSAVLKYRAPMVTYIRRVLVFDRPA